MSVRLAEPNHSMIVPFATGMDRRAFLRTGAALGAGLAAPRFGRAADHRGQRIARNVIFMVSDGMSTGTLTLADMAARERLRRPSRWVSLWQREGVRRASAFTASADSAVTDSAAGGSAWGCGKHVNNNALNTLPDGR